MATRMSESGPVRCRWQQRWELQSSGHPSGQLHTINVHPLEVLVFATDRLLFLKTSLHDQIPAETELFVLEWDPFVKPEAAYISLLRATRLHFPIGQLDTKHRKMGSTFKYGCFPSSYTCVTIATTGVDKSTRDSIIRITVYQYKKKSPLRSTLIQRFRTVKSNISMVGESFFKGLSQVTAVPSQHFHTMFILLILPEIGLSNLHFRTMDHEGIGKMKVLGGRQCLCRNVQMVDCRLLSGDRRLIHLSEHLRGCSTPVP